MKRMMIGTLSIMLLLTACGGESAVTPATIREIRSAGAATQTVQLAPTETVAIEGGAAPANIAEGLIGKWHSDAVNGMFEFFPNGIAVQTRGGGAILAGRYALSADGKMLQFENDNGPSALPIELSGDALTLNRTEFKRAGGVAGVAQPNQSPTQRILGWWQQGNYNGTGYDFYADGTYAIYQSGEQKGKGRYQVSEDGSLTTFVEPFGTQMGVRQRQVQLFNDAYLIFELANVYLRTQDAPAGTQQASGTMAYQPAQAQAGGVAPSIMPTAMPYPVDFQVSLKGQTGPYYRDFDYNAGGTPDTSQDELVTISGEMLKEPVPLNGREGSYSGRLMPGNYMVHVRSKGHADTSVPVTLTEENRTLDVPLKAAPLEQDPANLIALGTKLLRYDTGEVVRSGHSFDFVRALRPDRASFLGLDPQNSGNPWVIFASGEYWQQLTPDLPQFSQTSAGVGVPKAMTSPDAKRALFVLEGDLWLGEVNWDAGTIENAKQVTQVGLFRNARGTTVNWHPNGRVVAIDGTYRVDLETGDVKTIEGLSAFSPNSRYAQRPSSQSVAIYDLATDTEFQSSANRDRGSCWLNDDRAIFAEKDGLWVISGTTEARVNASGFEIDSIAGCRGDYAVVYPQPNPNQTAVLMNVETGQHVDMPARATEMYVAGDYAVVGVQDQSNLEARGTFLLNLTNGELKKLSAYPVNPGGDKFAGFGMRGANALVLLDKNAVLFVANEHVWKSDLSGTPAKRLIEGDDAWANRSTAFVRITALSQP